MINRTEPEIMEHWTNTEERNPLVSIVCVTYNQENYIEECLDSLLVQKTLFPFEILICDDASTDKTTLILEGYHLKYPNIIKPVFCKNNHFSQGIKPNYIFNFPRANGKYVAFCEGDDYWVDSQKLSTQVNVLEQNEQYSACAHNTVIKREVIESDENELIVSKQTKDVFNVDDITKGEVYFHTSSMLYRNIYFTNFPEKYITKYIGDWFLLILHATWGPIKYIDQVMSVYRIHSEGVWSKLTEEERLVRNLKAIISFNEVFAYEYDHNFIPLFIRRAATLLNNQADISIEGLLDEANNKSLFSVVKHAFDKLHEKDRIISEQDLVLLEDRKRFNQLSEELRQIYNSRSWKLIEMIRRLRWWGAH